MRNVVLYIAMSLDGYIADYNGGISWLNGDGSEPNNMGSYPKFIDSVDTVILGYKTYHQIVTELSPDSWVYAGKQSYILTHRNEQSTEEIIFTGENIGDLISRLKSEDGKDIWICGGATIVNNLLESNLIDTYRISVIPTILGSGIPLFTKQTQELKLKLTSTQSNNGIVELNYVRR